MQTLKNITLAVLGATASCLLVFLTLFAPKSDFCGDLQAARLWYRNGGKAAAQVLLSGKEGEAPNHQSRLAIRYSMAQLQLQAGDSLAAVRVLRSLLKEEEKVQLPLFSKESELFPCWDLFDDYDYADPDYTGWPIGEKLFPATSGWVVLRLASLDLSDYYLSTGFSDSAWYFHRLAYDRYREFDTGFCGTPFGQYLSCKNWERIHLLEEIKDWKKLLAWQLGQTGIDAFIDRAAYQQIRLLQQEHLTPAQFEQAIEASLETLSWVCDLTLKDDAQGRAKRSSANRLEYEFMGERMILSDAGAWYQAQNEDLLTRIRTQMQIRMPYWLGEQRIEPSHEDLLSNNAEGGHQFRWTRQENGAFWIERY